MEMKINILNRLLGEKSNKHRISSRVGQSEYISSDNEEVEIVCPKCGATLNRKLVVQKKYICYECGYYFRVKTVNRIRMVADIRTFEPWFEDIRDSNPLDFPNYQEKIADVREKTDISEAVTIGKCKIYGKEAVIGVMDSRFLMGSMGQIVGERITAGIERATREKLPVFMFCCSGGARMQEGIISLMQMAKTSAAVEAHGKAGLFYGTILTDPTTGGVTASFASLGDIILAEPGALIGFAGQRVIKQTIGQELPPGFQSAESLLEHGFLDGIVERKNLRKVLYYILITHEPDREGHYANFYDRDKFNPGKIFESFFIPSSPMSAWEKVKEVRQATRPSARDYMEHIFNHFIEAHGDRLYGDDGAIMAGIALLDGQPVTVVADMRGSTLAECQARNFGMPMPEGYRKALRIMKQAEKFNRPIISFVNTAGAYCGVDAEERGQGEAIARNLLEMSGLKVPVLCIMIGEGGSGGALATAVGNQVWMLENATYSILSPEGFATILWKDGQRAQEASEVMGITATDLKKLGVIEKIIPEYGVAGADNIEKIAGFMKSNIREFLKSYENMTGEEIAKQRYDRFRQY